MELKPCPFCGKPAVQIYNVNTDRYKYGCYTIRCMGNASHNLVGFKTDKEAAEAWNRRVNDGSTD